MRSSPPAGSPERVGDLVAERLAAFDREAVVGPLAGERDRALRDRLAAGGGRWGRPVSPSRRGTTWTAAPSSSSRRTTGSSAHVGHEHVEVPLGGARDDARGERRVPTARDREGPVASGDQPDALHHLQPDQHAHQVPRLVRAGDVAGLVLHPERAGSSRAGRERRAPRARRRASRGTRPVDRGHAVVERPHERDVARRRTSRGRARRRTRGRARGTGRTGSGRRRRGTPTVRREHRADHVVDVVAVDGRGQRKGYGSSGPSDGTAARAQERDGRRRSSGDSRYPDAAVEVVDQAVPHGDGSRRPCQNDWSRRADEVLDRDALLLDPREVAEVEDPLAVLGPELEQVVVVGAQQVLAERLAQRPPRRTRRRSPARGPCRARSRTSRRRRSPPSRSRRRAQVECFASLIAASTLQMLESPSDESASICVGWARPGVPTR